MQRRDDVHRAQRRLGNLAFDKIHAGKAAFGGDLLRGFDQVGARFHRNHPPAPGGREIQIIENEAQIGFARAQIGQHRLVFLSQHRVDGRLYQLRQMLHLFQLAPRIRVQPAIVGEDVQRLEQRHRLAGPQILQGIFFRLHLARHPSNIWVMPYQ